MKKRIAINGFGRIGRMCFHLLADSDVYDVVAINDLSPPDTLAHLLKYDSVHGRAPFDIEVIPGKIKAGVHEAEVFSEKDPAKLPWKTLRIDLVIEASGHFTDADSAGAHIQAGAAKVLITAPAKGVKTIVPGVNESEASDHHILSNASCTTNCLAPMVQVLEKNIGIEKGFLTTVHAYTADQRLHDAPHRDLRRARAAALNIVPTTTGAAKAVAEVIPSMKGRLDGVAVRVPVPDGSLTDFVVVLKRETTIREVNELFRNAVSSEMKNIIEYTEDPIVSTDIIGNPHSCIFDAALTSVNGNLVKVMAWYDNEAGYSHRVIDLLKIMTR